MVSPSIPASQILLCLTVLVFLRIDFSLKAKYTHYFWLVFYQGNRNATEEYYIQEILYNIPLLKCLQVNSERFLYLA